MVPGADVEGADARRKRQGHGDRPARVARAAAGPACTAVSHSCTSHSMQATRCKPLDASNSMQATRCKPLHRVSHSCHTAALCLNRCMGLDETTSMLSPCFLHHLATNGFSLSGRSQRDAVQVGLAGLTHLGHGTASVSSGACPGRIETPGAVRVGCTCRTVALELSWRVAAQAGAARTARARPADDCRDWDSRDSHRPSPRPSPSAGESLLTAIPM